MTLDRNFLDQMQQLIITNEIIIDRIKDTPHPRYSDMIYPLDYGYVENTFASDGDGIDAWMSNMKQKELTGILCIFDTVNRDAEIKLLIGCTEDDVQFICNFHNKMHTLYIPNLMAVK